MPQYAISYKWAGLGVNQTQRQCCLLMPENPLESLIFEEVRTRGPMTFARFMELALYHEPWGYYSSGPERIGVGATSTRAPWPILPLGRC